MGNQAPRQREGANNARCNHGDGVLRMPLTMNDKGWAQGGSWPVTTKQAADVGGPFRQPPQVCVFHYDAGIQKSSVDILTRKDRIYISAHFSLGRDGNIVQMVDLDDVAYHAGDAHRSVFAKLPRGYGGGGTLNYTAIGIEIENLGWLNKWDRTHAWREEVWKGQVARTPRVPIDECVFGPHPIRKGRDFFWPKYPEVQMTALCDLLFAIREYHKEIDYLLGHDEVSVHKYDPGPAFDLDDFRAAFQMKDLNGVIPNLEAAA